MEKIWADQGFAGRLVDWSAVILRRTLDIVRKNPGQKGFKVQPKRWTVSAPSPGSPCAADWPATTNATRHTPKP